MKFLVIAFFVFCVALANCTSDEIIKKIMQHRTECIAESGADEDIIKKTEEGIFEDDAKLKAFFVCFMKKPGFINDEGEYQVDAIKAKITDKYDEATADKYIKECLKDNHGNAEDNALHMAKCYYEHVLKGNK